jgi:hypothetical protein
MNLYERLLLLGYKPRRAPSKAIVRDDMPPQQKKISRDSVKMLPIKHVSKRNG